MNILILEDDETLLTTLSTALEEKGHTVSKANNGTKAVDMVMGGLKVDLIICDLMIPVISGVTFLSMRKDLMIEDAQVIVMSSLGEANLILQKLDIGFGYFLRKPIQFEKLWEFISEIEANLNLEKHVKKSGNTQ